MMTPEQIEQAAKMAYTTFRAQDRTAPNWEDLPNQYKWRDMVTDYERSPHAKPANFQEECVKAAVDAAGVAIILVADTDSPLPLIPKKRKEVK